MCAILDILKQACADRQKRIVNELNVQLERSRLWRGMISSQEGKPKSGVSFRRSRWYGLC